MASPLELQVRRRKFIYIGLILVLFAASWGWRKTVIDGLAEKLAIREEGRGEVELTGAVVRLGLTGSRGLATCILWANAIEKQKKNQWNELEVLVNSLAKLQPHFITPWLFQSWNLAYNVSVESDRVRDKYFYITKGIRYLATGERQNQNHPDLRWSIGFYLQQKICASDETNYQRSLFQLSLIPPHERDPARFWKDGSEINWVELEDFCKKHPQLARRLSEGMQRETQREKKKLFTCERAEQVIQFLEDNYYVPSLWETKPLPPGASNGRTWLATSESDKLHSPADRFPILPDPDTVKFDPQALATGFTPRDDIDGYLVAHSWFAYSQDPLPPPSRKLPGNSEEITDPAKQRRPKNITTLIFRNYPAQACRYVGERLQQEGWYDDEPWDASETWFRDARGSEMAGKDFRYGGGTKWSLEAWKRAYREWTRHGEENKLLFPSPQAEENTRRDAQAFANRARIPVGGMPPPLREDAMDAQERNEFEAAKFMFEYDFYRRVSNFPHHHTRTMVEAREETVACRKLLYQANQLETSGTPNPPQALATYRQPIEVASVEAWRGKQLTPLEAWRELVLKKNKDFRRDTFAQEQSAEYELRYLRLFTRSKDGQDLKLKVARAAKVLPLVPTFSLDENRLAIIDGPLSGVDEEGVPWIDLSSRDTVMDRLGIPSRRRQVADPVPTEPTTQPGMIPGERPPPDAVPSKP